MSRGEFAVSPMQATKFFFLLWNLQTILGTLRLIKGFGEYGVQFFHTIFLRLPMVILSIFVSRMRRHILQVPFITMIVGILSQKGHFVSSLALDSNVIVRLTKG